MSLRSTTFQGSAHIPLERSGKPPSGNGSFWPFYVFRSAYAYAAERERERGGGVLAYAMRAALAFFVTFGLCLLALLWLSEEMRILPRGPDWLLLCLGLGAWSAEYFRKGGRADDTAANLSAKVSERILPFGVPSPKEEALWADVAVEFAGPERRAGLYAKALAAANGDEGRAKANYMKARVAEERATK